MKLLSEKVAIIIGAARGLGKYFARRLAYEGCHLVICDLNQEEINKTKKEVESKIDRKVVAVTADVTNEKEVTSMVEAAIREFSNIDYLISNAALSYSGSIHDFDLKAWKRLLDVNLYGYFLCVREVSKIMIKNRYGSIVQINSRTGKRGSAKNSAYAASKGGGIVLTQSLSAELAEYNIRVNCVGPSAMFA